MSASSSDHQRPASSFRANRNSGPHFSGQKLELPPEGQLTTQPIGTFTTEAGVDIPSAVIGYRRWGEPRFKADGTISNLVLVEHALTGDTDAVTWWPGLVGPGCAIDTDQFLVICTNVLGGCSGSTGPSSAHPDGGYWGSRFPALSIRDLVAAEYQFLTTLGLSHVYAIIGGSLGGTRTLEWTMMYPDVVSYAMVIAASARASAWQIGIQSAQIHFITEDPAWSGGDYYDTDNVPDQGMGNARRIAHLTYRGELEVDERFSTDPQAGENPYGPYRDARERFAVESYLDYQAAKLVERFDAGSYVILTDSLNRHDVGRGRGGMNVALGHCQVPTMVAGIDTDILYPFHQQEHLSRNLGSFIGLARIASPVGHDGFLVETRQLERAMSRFFTKANIMESYGK